MVLTRALETSRNLLTWFVRLEMAEFELTVFAWQSTHP